jgi:microcystin degradation protein MlrC
MSEGATGARRRLRIAYGRINQETNAFSPVPTTVEDFRALHFVEGPALAALCGRGRHEVEGMIRNAELSGFVRATGAVGWGRIETVPLLSAWAMPSGPLTEEAYLALRDRIVESLSRAGPVEGVFLALHGAMRARGATPDPEEGFLSAVREVVGPDVRIAATFDLHGLLTPGKADPLTAAYRTNPHRDLARTGYRAGALLVRALLGEIHPTSTWRSLPMVLGGGKTLDFLPPMRSLFRRMRAMERTRGVLSASLFLCHVWNDSPDLGWSVHVSTDGEPELADELAERAWEVRHARPPRFLSPEEALERTRRSWLARRFGTVTWTDTSDVVGAGAPGESTHLARAILSRGRDLVALVPIRDADAVSTLWELAPGEPVELSVGGRLDPRMSPPLEVKGRLRSKHSTRHFGRVVVVSVERSHLVLTERAPLPRKPSFYADLGLSPWRADLVIVKSFFHFRLYYLAVNRKSLLVATRGHTDLDLVLGLSFTDAVHPKDPVDDWHPADRRRRGLAPA